MYSEKTMEHFTCPQNAGRMPDAHGKGSFGDMMCGDFIRIFIKVEDEKISDISFLVFGCSASIATGSMTTVLARGKSIEDALKLTEQDVIDALDGLPEEKQHCSNLGIGALKAAINDYREKSKELPELKK